MVAPRAGRQRGFTYLSLIILVAIIGLAAAATLKIGAVIQRSRAEQELLDIGAAFSDALKSYADATPQGLPPQPPSLKELLRDPRFPGTRRHLRKIFVDPMTGKAEWGIVYLGDKTGVIAVYSLSNAQPVKIGNFPQRYAGFEGKKRISEWKFSATVSDAVAPVTEKQAQTTSSVSILQQAESAPQNITLPAAPAEVTPPAEQVVNPVPPSEESNSHSEKTPESEPEQPPVEPL